MKWQIRFECLLCSVYLLMSFDCHCEKKKRLTLFGWLQKDNKNKKIDHITIYIDGMRLFSPPFFICFLRALLLSTLTGLCKYRFWFDLLMLNEYIKEHTKEIVLHAKKREVNERGNVWMSVKKKLLKTKCHLNATTIA